MDSTASPQNRRSVPFLLGTLACIALGLLLLTAALAKALDPDPFVAQITTLGLDFLLPASFIAYLALALEAGLGLALALGATNRWVLLASLVLVLALLGVAGRMYWMDLNGTLPEDAGCGCFGNLVERTPGEAFWQDLAIFLPLAVLSFWGRRRGGEPPRLRLSLAAAAGVATVAFAAAAPDLPLDNWATQVRPGKDVSEICVGSPPDRTCLSDVLAGIEEGRHLVIIADIQSPEFRESIPAINEYVYRSADMGVWLLTDADDEAVNNFMFTGGAAFALTPAPGPLLKTMHRRLPRSFIVQDGEVETTFSGYPPEIGADSASGTPGSTETSS